MVITDTEIKVNLGRSRDLNSHKRIDLLTKGQTWKVRETKTVDGDQERETLEDKTNFDGREVQERSRRKDYRPVKEDKIAMILNKEDTNERKEKVKVYEEMNIRIISKTYLL